jgi:hypothetical protein
MKIILTEDQYGQLNEMIKLDIKVGDTIMGGKFKNKKVVVKTIGKNDKGDITINGKPLLRFRIIKESTSNDIEKIYKTYSKHLNELTKEFDWVSKIDVKLSSTADAGGWRDEESKPLLKVSVYFKNYQKIRMTTQFELFDEISFIHDMFFPHLTGDPHIYSDHSDNVTTYFSVKSVFPNGKTDSFPSQNQIVSGDYDAISQINESNDKNKKFLISVMGMDFTDKIQQITSTHDVPTSFDDGIDPSTIRTYLNFWGPMYLVNIDGENYLYQDRGDFEMFIDEDGYWNKDEIPEKLGIGILGLRFSDIVDMYFEEEDHR